MSIKPSFLLILLFTSISTISAKKSSSHHLKQISEFTRAESSSSTSVPNLPLLHIESSFQQTSMLGSDIGISGEGDVYVVGIDGKLYTYNFATNTYLRVIADPDLDGIARVDVDGEGTPYVVTNCGATYYLSCDGRWIQLPGCASDVGVGFCGQVWKTGCDKREGGFGVWKLFCSGTEKKCNRYRQFNYSSKYVGRISNRKKCYWYRVSGSGLRVDVYPDGKPAVVQKSGRAMKYNGYDWSMITSYPGRDVTVSNEGVVIMSGIDNGLYLIPHEEGDEFFDERYGLGALNADAVDEAKVDRNTKYVDVGCTNAVSAGPFAQPAVIPCATHYEPVVVLLQKGKYN